MSKNISFKLEVDEILTKSQKRLLAKIESLRLQIKQVSERELSKALIPIHDHKPGTTVGAGTEDVPYGKLNPPGVDKSMKKDLDGSGAGGGAASASDGVAGSGQGLAMKEKTAKAEKCMKCGDMHSSLEKCGTIKSDLVDEKGKLSSNSINTPFKDGAKVSLESFGDKGGIKLPGANLKKALTAGMGSGAPSTLINGDALAGKKKPKPSKPVVLTVQPDAERKSEESLGKVMPSGLKPAKAPSVAMSGNNGPHDAGQPLPKAEPPMAKPPSGKNMATAVPTSTAKSELTKGMFAQAAQQADPVSASHAAQVKPPAGGGIKLPGAHLQAARAQSHTDALAGAFQPKGPIHSGLELDRPAKPTMGLKSPKMGGFSPTMKSLNIAAKPPAIAPVSPANPQSTLHSPKPPAIAPVGLASPKAAGVTPSPAKPMAPAVGAPSAKPGIFGKISGFRKP